MQNKLFQTNSKILECVIGIKVIILNCSFKKRTLSKFDEFGRKPQVLL